MVVCDLYLKRFDLTKGLLLDTFSITVWYKLCRDNHSVTVWELESFSPMDLTCKRGSVGQSEGLSIPRSSVRFRQKPDNSNSHEFELHRPSNKGTKNKNLQIKCIPV